MKFSGCWVKRYGCQPLGDFWVFGSVGTGECGVFGLLACGGVGKDVNITNIIIKSASVGRGKKEHL